MPDDIIIRQAKSNINQTWKDLMITPQIFLHPLMIKLYLKRIKSKFCLPIPSNLNDRIFYMMLKGQSGNKEQISLFFLNDYFSVHRYRPKLPWITQFEQIQVTLKSRDFLASARVTCLVIVEKLVIREADNSVLPGKCRVSCSLVVYSVHFLNLYLKLTKSIFYFALSTNLNDNVFFLVLWLCSLFCQAHK
jgi:hypothetical protein